MEKHNCKLCLKSFANGRALGGHMRSHMLNLYVTPKPPLPSSPPSSSTEEDEDDGDDNLYGLRENPKKSLQLGDPDFAFPGALTVTLTTTAAGGGGVVGGSSVVLQDRESETETSKKAIVRRRSKRIRRQETSWLGDQQHFHELTRNKNQNQWQYLKKSKIFKPCPKTAESSTPEPVSSISDTSPEEDVAYCLMMLSRDKWSDEEEDREHEESDNESESDREIINVKRTPTRTKYRCETCNKVFRSYQALGGHRASHKKIKQSHHDNIHQTQNVAMEDKIHECPVCFKVFASGQALGGHKRSHVTASSASMAAAKPVAKQSINLIDLNLPAPIDEEDDEMSQIEVSVVSDGEFVITH
ncbi:zinc finger protein ZAT9 [Lactuca sativa]|uniref:zinc finger protein ZAT9 n=1 Tax=Lactuca sativa TaxID=4236 RepID=UPI000CBEB783|nr:zinc finger protein ZAT9 [Lactuca sativa]